MSLETVDDARRINALSRAEYARLLAYLERLPDEGWIEPSACRDWQVYQVVAHIGSQPAIIAGGLRAGLRGAAPMTDEDRRKIWGYFDNLRPLEVLPAFRKNNDDYFRLTESFSDEDLGRRMPWLGQEVPLATVFSGRLNEQVLHGWDVYWARDKQARLTPEALPVLLEMNMLAHRLVQQVKPDRAPRLAGKTIQFTLRDPAGAAYLQPGGDGPPGALGRAPGPDVTAELPTEAFIRLIWGRYGVRAGLESGELKLSDPGLADDLQALLPGR